MKCLQSDFLKAYLSRKNNLPLSNTIFHFTYTADVNNLITSKEQVIRLNVEPELKNATDAQLT